jgi:cysteine desulfurase/selenocysteine lyase
MEGSYANVHRGLHTLANETTDAFEAARETVAKFINAEPRKSSGPRAGPRRSIWWPTPSAVDPEGRRRDHRLGDGAPRQHRAVALPARARGVVLKFDPGHRRRPLDMEAYGPAGTAPRWWRSATCRTCWAPSIRRRRDRPPGPRGRRAGAARRLPGHRPRRPDVKALDVDFYVFSGHKLYGPTGIGVPCTARPSAWPPCRRIRAAAR